MLWWKFHFYPAVKEFQKLLEDLAKLLPKFNSTFFSELQCCCVYCKQLWNYCVWKYIPLPWVIYRRGIDLLLCSQYWLSCCQKSSQTKLLLCHNSTMWLMLFSMAVCNIPVWQHFIPQTRTTISCIHCCYSSCLERTPTSHLQCIVSGIFKKTA